MMHFIDIFFKTSPSLSESKSQWSFTTN